MPSASDTPGPAPAEGNLDRGLKPKPQDSQSSPLPIISP